MATVSVMADEKRGPRRGKKKPEPAPAAEGGEAGAGRDGRDAEADPETLGEKPYTTFRIFVLDGERLSELAEWEKTTIAKLFREMFREQLKDRYVKKLRQRLKDHQG
jgi:hypothetical protein